MDEEEDVVLQNSPLYAYMQGTDTVELADPIIPEPSSISPAVEQCTKPQNNRWKIFHKFRLNYFSKLEKTEISRICDFCIRSHLLEDTDKLFIQDNLQSVPFFTIQDCIGIFLPFVILLSSFSFLHIIVPESLSSNSYLFATFLLIACLTVSAKICISLLILLWKWYRLWRQIQTFVSLSSKLDQQFLMATRLIRERELLDWTYARKSISSGTKLPGAVLGRSVMKLRRLMFSISKQMLSLVQSQCRKVIFDKSIFSQEELSGFLSTVNRTELDPIFCCDQNQEIPTDWLSLSALKSLWQFVVLQRSEYLSVGCVFLLRSPTVAVDTVSDCISLCSSSTVQSLNDIGNGTRSLSNAFDSKTETKPKMAENVTKNEKSGVARNLTLHLEYALKSALELESDITHSNLVLVREAIKNSLDSCEEIDHLLNGDRDVAGDGDQSTIPAVPLTAEEKLPVNVVLIPEDYQVILKDQVFECETMGLCSPESGQNTSPNDTETDPKNAKVAKKMLTELKSALSVRAEEMKLRELKALADFRGISLEQMMEEDEKEEEEEIFDSIANDVDDEESESRNENIFDYCNMGLKNELMTKLAGQFQAFGASKNEEITFDDSD